MRTIIIRDDDVFPETKNKFAEYFKTFVEVHESIASCPRMVHVPTLIVRDLQNYPEAVRYIKSQTENGTMQPELHGLTHDDYGAKDIETVIAHVAEARGWFLSNLGFPPKRWYTPWGANQPHLHEAAKQFDIEIQNSAAFLKFRGRYGVKQLMSENRPASFFYDKQIVMHWWSPTDVQRLKMLVDYINNNMEEKANV